MSWFEKVLDYKKRGQVYVIAELGSNYRNYADMVNAIGLAKRAGADAIKYQYFYDKDLELYNDVGSNDRYDSQLGDDDSNFYFDRLKEKADKVGIDLIASTFSPEGIKAINPYVCAHKIASCEMSHVRLLEAAKETGKPIILSTGAYGVQDVKRVVDFVGSNYPLVLMHCNVAYPARFVDTEKFKALKTIFGGPLGFSDHTTSIDIVPAYFRDHGVCVYEKHWNPFELTDTPDAPHSLNTKEFMQMVSELRGKPSAFSEEGEARLKHVRRVIALTNIKPGDELKEGLNIGIYRSKTEDARGANPFAITEISGKKAKNEIKLGQGVSFTDVAQ